MSQSPLEPSFVDEQRRVHTGQVALEMVRAKNAAAGVDPEQGVVRVDRTRWEEAQRYERKTWMVDCRFHADDRNEYHKERFAGYAALRGMHFGRGIELGSGPFTNLRLILGACKIDEIHLLDPLLNDYVDHPFCSYKNGRLSGLLAQFHPLRIARDLRPLRQASRFVQNRVNAYRAGGWRGRPVNRIASPIEAYQTDLKFDLVVMINVIEHCLDGDKVFDKVLDLLKPGGIFVFADTLYHAKEVQQVMTFAYDAGHPLHIDASRIRQFLDRHFARMMHAEYARENVLSGMTIHNDELYWIGRKL